MEISQAQFKRDIGGKNLALLNALSEKEIPGTFPSLPVLFERGDMEEGMKDAKAVNTGKVFLTSQGFRRVNETMDSSLSLKGAAVYRNLKNYMVYFPKECVILYRLEE